MRNISKNTRNLLLCAIIGMMVFFVIYGFRPLDVTQDAWILQGYDETDLIQHYGGWTLFRNSPWSFPIGLATDSGSPDGIPVTYMDSIPWFAILFKLLSPVLPQTFQYFGLYTLLCYVLSAVGAGLLLCRWTDKTIPILLGALLFACSPILMERAFRHTALASHFLILFALYYYLEYRSALAKDPQNAKWPWQTLLLNALAIGTHPYFLPMTLAFTGLCWLEALLKKRGLKTGIYLFATVALTILVGYLIGAIGWENAQYSRDGYGYYAMNLNALWNPVSIGGYQWSRFLPAQEQMSGHYDGFNYLGLGVLAGLVALPAFMLFRKGAAPLSFLKRNLLLLLLCLGLSVFAVSNAICLNDQLLFEIVLPHRLVVLCSIMRASGRMFYPVYYIILLFLLRGVFRLSERRRVAGLIALVLICSLQLVDLSGAVLQKHTNMTSAQSVSVYDKLPEDLRSCERFDLLIPIGVPFAEQRTLGVISGKLGLLYAGNLGTSTNVNCPQAAQLCALANECLLVGKADETAIYATTSQGLFDRWIAAFEQSDQDMLFFQIESFYFAAPAYSDCELFYALSIAV